MIPREIRQNTWIIIPAFNEAPRIGATLDGLVRLWPNIVVVDDGSTDSTATEACARRTWLVSHAVNMGQGAAIQTGLVFALARDAAYLVTFDADGQHDPADIDGLLEPLVAGEADFALGSRFLGTAPGIPLTRWLLLSLAVAFTRRVSRMRLTDVHNGLRALTRRGAEALDITLDGMEHASQVLEQIRVSGFRYVERPVTIRYTRESLAKGQRSMAAVKLAIRLVLERVARR